LKLKKNNRRLIIAIDGLGGSGKSLGAKLIAKKYKLRLLNSGLCYRFASFLLLKYRPKNKIFFLKKKFKNLNYRSLNNLNLHTQEISNFTAQIAKQKKIRLIIKSFQKKFSNKYQKIAIEGRDSASKILNKNPRYDISFFFKCNLNTAAFRRWKDLKTLNRQITLQEVKESLKKRNDLDIKRRFSPLIQSKDSIIIRTDILSKKEMVVKMSKEIEKKLLVKNERKYRSK
jgi:cytidylate kinase